EVHILQGERELAVDNKSLGRFKLTGIPPAPRGVPQVQVALDIDANGILQVTALDKTTGREQSVVIQGASTLSQDEVNRMIRDAEKYAEVDRLQREKVEKRNRAQALTYQAERQLREVALDYGMQFAQRQRSRIETLVRSLRDSLERNDDRGIDQISVDLQDALYELNREVSVFATEDDEDDLFGSIRRTFSGEKRRVDPYEPQTRSYPRYDQQRNNNGSSLGGGVARSRRPTQTDNWDDDDDWL
ncbi:MAG: Hsp70 family protein, partial [Planktothrix sp.]